MRTPEEWAEEFDGFVNEAAIREIMSAIYEDIISLIEGDHADVSQKIYDRMLEVVGEEEF